jgi:hypothetical protein
MLENMRVLRQVAHALATLARFLVAVLMVYTLWMIVLVLPQGAIRRRLDFRLRRATFWMTAKRQGIPTPT